MHTVLLPPGLPTGVLPVAQRWARAAHQTLGLVAPTDSDVMQAVALPLRLEADWPGPAAPRRVGTADAPGWVQADLTDDDLETFDRLRATYPGADAETIAAHAQQWRLPVVPYRRQAPPVSWRAATEQTATEQTATGRVTGEPVALDAVGLRVVDLSSLWAGPWFTQLLRRAGARVTKVDPDCRPDGFRERPTLYTELNDGKQVIDLDLRTVAGRTHFEALVARADVLVSSFSRRVLPNLGYDATALSVLNPQLRTVNIVGFGEATPEADWLTYGSGIHAASGLGFGPHDANGSDSPASGRAAPTPALVAYPDPLAGYLAVLLLAGLAPGQSTEVPLAAAGYEVWSATQATAS